jgi:chromosome segregation ATPase
MAVNAIVHLAKVVGDIDSLQSAIADLERRAEEAELASSRESIAGIRNELSKLKAALGEARNEEAFWRQEIAENTRLRKEQGNLANA